MGRDALPPGLAHRPCVRCQPQDDPRAVLRRLGLVQPRPALFVSGGARQIAPEHEALASGLLHGVARAAAALDLVLVSGGTNCGVMALLGTACADLPQPPPLIGVLPSGMLAQRGPAILEPHHSHFLLVEGEDWGTESGWLSRLTVALTGGQHPCLGLLINGGRVARRDLTAALEQGLSVWVLQGSGRLADELARARQGATVSDPQLHQLAQAPALKIIRASIGAAALEQRLRSYFSSQQVGGSG